MLWHWELSLWAGSGIWGNIATWEQFTWGGGDFWGVDISEQYSPMWSNNWFKSKLGGQEFVAGRVSRGPDACLPSGLFSGLYAAPAELPIAAVCLLSLDVTFLGLPRRNPQHTLQGLAVNEGVHFLPMPQPFTCGGGRQADSQGTSTKKPEQGRMSCAKKRVTCPLWPSLTPLFLPLFLTCAVVSFWCVSLWVFI